VGLVTPEPERIPPRVERPLRLEAHDLEELLFDFLHEILSCMDRDDVLLPHAESLRLRGGPPWTLEGLRRGDRLANVESTGAVKAVTYSDMRIVREPEGWRIEVVVDV